MKIIRCILYFLFFLNAISSTSAAIDITVVNPTNTTYYTSSIDLQWESNNNVSWSGYSLDGTTNISFSEIASCYQESINVSTSCGGLSTGTYFGGNNDAWRNGIWDSEYTTICATPTDSVYINATIPIHATNLSSLQTDNADYSNIFWEDLSHSIYSTTINNVCFDYSISNNRTLQLRISHDEWTFWPYISGQYGLNLECYNGTSWYAMQRFGTSANGCYYFSRLYETGINWSMRNIGNIVLDGLVNGSHTLTIYANDTDGNMNSSSTITFYILNKSDNPISLNSSNGWSMYVGDSTSTITCTAPEGTTEFKINNIIVSSPYSYTFQQGIYEIQCNVYNETTNYRPTNKSSTLVVNEKQSCVDNETYAYEKTITPSANITTINMTDAVMANSVKSDLSDVYIPDLNQVWTNMTDGYFLVLNTTNMSEFTIYFGNYFASINHSQHPLSNNFWILSPYTQNNPTLLLNIRDELNNVQMYPPESTMIAIVQCQSGETYIPIYENDTQIMLATTSSVSKALVRVSYSATSYYSRQLYTSSASNTTQLSFFVADAQKTALDRIDFHMLDSSQYNSKFQIYKTLDNTVRIITEGYFDASRYFSAYLVEDTDYYLRTVDGSGTITEYGRITIVAPAEKELGQASLTLNPESVLISNKIGMNSWANTGWTSLYVTYNDAMSQTNDINITVYHENGTIFQNAYYASTNNVNLEYNITDYANETFTVKFILNHQIFGNSPVPYTISVVKTFLWDLGVGSSIYNLASMIMIVLVGGIVTRKSFIVGEICFIASILILRSIGWLTLMSDLAIVFIIILCLIGTFIYFKQGGE